MSIITFLTPYQKGVFFNSRVSLCCIESCSYCRHYNNQNNDNKQLQEVAFELGCENRNEDQEPEEKNIPTTA